MNGGDAKLYGSSPRIMWQNEIASKTNNKLSSMAPHTKDNKNINNWGLEKQDQCHIW